MFNIKDFYFLALMRRSTIMKKRLKSDNLIIWMTCLDIFAWNEMQSWEHIMAQTKECFATERNRTSRKNETMRNERNESSRVVSSRVISIQINNYIQYKAMKTRYWWYNRILFKNRVTRSFFQNVLILRKNKTLMYIRNKEIIMIFWNRK